MSFFDFFKRAPAEPPGVAALPDLSSLDDDDLVTLSQKLGLEQDAIKRQRRQIAAEIDKRAGD